MTPYILRRFLHTIPVLVIVSMMTFLGVEMVPGEPVLALLDPASGSGASPEDISRLKEQYGLNAPLPLRYLHYAERTVHGDFGVSIGSQRPVSEVIRERLPVTLWLNGITLAISVTLGVILGLIAGARPGGKIDFGVTLVAVAGVAVPGFWLAIFLILLFSLNLGWFPASGWVDPLKSPWQALRHLVLPVVTLSLTGIAVLARQTRSAVVEVMRNDYITTARSKGLSRRSVLFGHALKNSMLPVITVIGLQVSALFGGSVLVERVFAIPGLGRLAFDATFRHDFPVIQGLVFLVTLTVLTVNLLTDVAYAFLDPRIRFQ